MNDAQVYVNALREGSYFKALGLTPFIIEKYRPIKDPIGGDELIQLAIYELSQTDINKNDIEAVNFLYNYIQYHTSLKFNESGYFIMTLLSSLSIVLALQEAGLFKDKVAAVKIENRTEFDGFLDEHSDFSQFITENMKNSSKWQSTLTTSFNEEALLKKIETMEHQLFANFQSNIHQLIAQLPSAQASFFCPLVHNRGQTKKLKETIDKYKTHLKAKLENENIIIDADEQQPVLFMEPTAKQQKLINRYKLIEQLSRTLQAKIVVNQNDIDLVLETMEACSSNEASWYERDTSQRYTDMITLGLKPLYRNFFSREPYLKEKITEIARSTLFQQ